MNKLVFGLVFLFVCSNATALPIDWHGAFGVDTTNIAKYRKGAGVDPSPTTGSEVIPSGSGQKGNASFQSYIFRLNPNIVVNDSANIFGEITTGYGRGGFFGDSSINRANNANASKNSSYGNSIYYYNTSNSNSNLVLNKFYMELYADTATFILGRQPINWGLGAVFNEGNGTWDRHTSVNDGISAKFKLGNFKFTPHWAKINAAAGKTDDYNVTDYGVQALYDNPDKDMAMGLYYGKRKSDQFNNFYASNYSSSVTGGAITTPSNMGDTNIKLIDVYFRKKFSKFSFNLEAPFISGNLGHAFNSQTKTKYGAKAIITESKLELSEKWTLSLFLGTISGADGDMGKFSAMYLNPNYQIANVLFRYNYYGITNTNQNIWDAYMTNARYAKLGAKYSNESWVWNAAVIYATAEKTAVNGTTSFDHETNQRFTSNASQGKKYGYEADLSFDFLWNPNVTVTGTGGYLFSGDYYKFSNTATGTKGGNMYVTSLSTAINF